MKEKAKVQLTKDMKRVLNEQRLGFIASVCPDGTPNLSPKGTTAVWDDEHIIASGEETQGDHQGRPYYAYVVAGETRA